MMTEVWSCPVSSALVNIILALLVSRDVGSFKEKDPLVRLLVKVVCCFGADRFHKIVCHLPASATKINSTALVALCSHAQSGQWKQFKNCVKAVTK
jgi:hypothetical protein